MPDPTKDLSTYEEGYIPDEDYATCLKVIRSVRNVCLGPAIFYAEGAVVLSSAHKVLVDLYEKYGTPD